TLSFIRFSFFTSIYALRISADIVLATSTPLSIAIPALVKKAFQNVPYIFEVRDVWPEAPIALGVIRGRLAISILQYFEKLVYKHSKAVVALSVDMRKSIVDRFGSLSPIYVIPNISEVDRFEIA